MSIPKFLFLGIFFASVMSVYCYIYINVINPTKQFDNISNKAGIKTLTHIKDLKKDQIEMGDLTIVKSVEAICRLSDDIDKATVFIEAIENGKLYAEYKGSEGSNGETNPLANALLNMRGQMLTFTETEKNVTGQRRASQNLPTSCAWMKREANSTTTYL